MFKVIVQVSWKSEPQQIELYSLRDLFGSFPLISKKFFQDLVNNIQNNGNYFAERGFNSLIGPPDENDIPQIYEPHDWIFVWAEDFKERIFWILFSRSVELSGHGAIAAVGPSDFARFLQETGKEAIIATLTLLIDPQKMNSVAVIVSSPQDAKKARGIGSQSPELNQFQNWITSLKTTPNIKGQWFPNYKPICPVCNEHLLGAADYNIGFVQLLCPRCGYKRQEKT